MRDEITMEKVAIIAATCILILVNLFVWFTSWMIIVSIFIDMDINVLLISISTVVYLTSSFTLNKTYNKLISIIKV